MDVIAGAFRARLHREGRRSHSARAATVHAPFARAATEPAEAAVARVRLEIGLAAVARGAVAVGCPLAAVRAAGISPAGVDRGRTSGRQAIADGVGQVLGPRPWLARADDHPVDLDPVGRIVGAAVATAGGRDAVDVAIVHHAGALAAALVMGAPAALREEHREEDRRQRQRPLHTVVYLEWSRASTPHAAWSRSGSPTDRQNDHGPVSST